MLKTFSSILYEVLCYCHCQPEKRGAASLIIDKNDLSYLVVLSNTEPETVKQDFVDGKRS